MRIDYSLNDTTSGRTHSDIAFWEQHRGRGQLRRLPYLQHGHAPAARPNVPVPRPAERRLPLAAQRAVVAIPIDRHAADERRHGLQPEPDERHDRLRDRRASRGSHLRPQRTRRRRSPSGRLHAMRLAHAHAGPDPANNRAADHVSSYPCSTGPLCVSPHAKISIVSVPLDAPERASVIATPTIDAPPYIGVGCHAHHRVSPSQSTKQRPHASPEGQIWDISDPANPCTRFTRWFAWTTRT